MGTEDWASIAAAALVKGGAGNDPVIGDSRGNIYFLTDDERQGVLWAIRLGLAHDDGFPFPRDQNRVILRSAQDKLTFPHKTEDVDA